MNVSILFCLRLSSGFQWNFPLFSLLQDLKNSLRGFPLNGCNFKVPEAYQGIIFQETQRPLNETDDRTFKVSGVFDEFKYWNYDKLPSENDKLKQALQWNEFAAAIHKPIDPKEFADRFNSSNDKENSK